MPAEPERAGEWEITGSEATVADESQSTAFTTRPGRNTLIMRCEPSTMST